MLRTLREPTFRQPLSPVARGPALRWLIITLSVCWRMPRMVDGGAPAQVYPIASVRSGSQSVKQPRWMQPQHAFALQ